MWEKLQRFMAGRYGSDQLNLFLMIVSLICIVLSWFTFRIIVVPGLACLIYSYVRMLSRDYAKRSAENAKYMALTGRARSLFQKRKKMWSQRKTHKFFKCPSCHQQIRVPKGHGHVQITCPKCRATFEGNT